MIQDSLKDENFEENVFPHFATQLLPSISGYSRNSVLSTIERHGAPLLSALDTSCPVDHKAFALCLFLEKSSVMDWKYRKFWLEEKLRVLKDDDSLFLKEIIGEEFELFASNLFESIKDLLNKVPDTTGECIVYHMLLCETAIQGR